MSHVLTIYQKYKQDDDVIQIEKKYAELLKEQIKTILENNKYKVSFIDRGSLITGTQIKNSDLDVDIIILLHNCDIQPKDNSRILQEKIFELITSDLIIKEYFDEFVLSSICIKMHLKQKYLPFRIRYECALVIPTDHGTYLSFHGSWKLFQREHEIIAKYYSKYPNMQIFTVFLKYIVYQSKMKQYLKSIIIIGLIIKFYKKEYDDEHYDENLIALLSEAVEQLSNNYQLMIEGVTDDLLDHNYIPKELFINDLRNIIGLIQK
jgi:hypothetical protein